MKQIGDFILVNAEKVNRAIYGMVGQHGQSSGGVGEDASDDAILAEYDRLGGLVTKDGNTVKMGSFYDFDKRTPRKEPEVTLIFRDIKDRIVEIPDGEELPMSVKAAQASKKLDKKEAEEDEDEKPKKKRGKKSIEDEE